MSNSNFATVADLVGQANEIKEISLKSIKDKNVKIKRASIGVISNVMKVAGDNVLEQFIWLTISCLVEPKLNEKQVRGLPHKVVIEIGGQIARLSGMDADSVNEIQNLLGTKP